jgi:hypothetical protein
MAGFGKRLQKPGGLDKNEQMNKRTQGGLCPPTPFGNEEKRGGGKGRRGGERIIYLICTTIASTLAAFTTVWNWMFKTPSETVTGIVTS